MKVLQIFNQYKKFGGEENSVNRIALQLENNGCEVRRFIRSAEEWAGPEGPPKWKQPFLLGRNRKVLEELKEVHQDFEPDLWLIHNVIPVISLGVYPLAGEMGVPLIQWLHNYRPISLSGSLRLKNEQLETTSSYIHFKEVIDGAWRGRASSLILALTYARAKYGGWFGHVSSWVAVSETMMNSFKSANFFPEKLDFLRHSWEIELPLNEEAEDATFLFLGRLLPEKGLLFLIDIFKDPRMSHLKLVIAGDGPLRAEVEMTNNPNIEYVGWVSGLEKKQLINRAKAILFPSLWEEPLSTIAYEAYEQARALVTSDRGGMVEIVEDGETGFILPADDAERWIQCLNYLLEEPNRTKILGEKGRLWLEENVSAEIWYDGFRQITEKVFRD